MSVYNAFSPCLDQQSPFYLDWNMAFLQMLYFAIVNFNPCFGNMHT